MPRFSIPNSVGFEGAVTRGNQHLHPWDCMGLHGTAWDCMGLHGPPLSAWRRNNHSDRRLQKSIALRSGLRAGSYRPPHTRSLTGSVTGSGEDSHATGAISGESRVMVANPSTANSKGATLANDEMRSSGTSRGISSRPIDYCRVMDKDSGGESPTIAPSSSVHRMDPRGDGEKGTRNQLPCLLR